MRVYDNGSYFTVQYSRQDCENFNRMWPCSTVRGSGSFQFEKDNGDLVDATGTAAKYGDDSSWLAFSQDCQKYGESKLSAGK